MRLSLSLSRSPPPLVVASSRSRPYLERTALHCAPTESVRAGLSFLTDVCVSSRATSFASVAMCESMFSSREVHAAAGGVLVLLLRVPVPAGGYVARTVEDNEVPLKFLPHVEIQLIPTEELGAQYIARISCVWLSFRQVSVLIVKMF